MRKKELQKEIVRLKRRIEFFGKLLEFCTERIESLENHTRDGLIHADAEQVDDLEGRLTKLEEDKKEDR